MSGLLTHSPADIIRRLLIALGHGVDPPAPVGTPWPIYTFGEPTLPEEAITITDTTGRIHGRIHYDGEMLEHHGIQARIRAAIPSVGWTRANRIARAMDTEMTQRTVTIDGSSYLVWSVTRTNGPLAIGKEIQEGKRAIFTVNALVAVEAR